MPVVHADVIDRPLDIDALYRAVDDPASGAVAVFVGRIRDHDPEASGEVVALDYSGHPESPVIIRQLAERVASELDPAGETKIAVEHRIGAQLGVGELAIVACVSSGHRALAFDVCRALVEVIKAELPIWKHQHEASGRAVWSNLGLER